MKKKIFSRGLYIEGLRQLKLTGIIFLAVFLLIGIAVPVIDYINYLDRISYMASDYSYTPRVVEFLEMNFMTTSLPFVVAPVFTFIMFGAFNKRSSSDFYHSLPYTRICMFNSFVGAIFTWILGIAIVYCSINYIIYACLPQIYIISAVGLCDIILTILVQILMVVFAIICAMSVTGTPIANITVACLILFLPRLIITFVAITMGDLAPIIDGHYGIFDPDFNVIWGLIYSIFDSGVNPYAYNIGADIYSLVIAVAYGVCSALLFCKRKSETAGNPAPGRRVQSVIRVCVGLVISSVVTCGLIMEFELSAAIILYPIAIIAYFAYEAITQKGFRTIPKTLPGLAVLVGLNVLIVAFCYGSSAVVHAYAPEADEVSAIYLESEESYGYDRIDYSNYASEKASSIKIEDKKAIAIAVENLKENIERSKNGNFYSAIYDYDTNNEGAYEEYYYLTVSFVSNGVKHTRNLSIPESDHTALMNQIEENDAYKDAYMELPDAMERTISIYYYNNRLLFDFTNEECMEIYECMQKELEGVSFSDWVEHLTLNNYDGIEIDFTTANDSTGVRLWINSDILPKTFSLIAEKQNEKEKDEIDNIYDILENWETKKDEYNYIDMQIYSREWSAYVNHSRYDEGEKDEYLASDLKALAEGMKNGEFSVDDYITLHMYAESLDEKEYHYSETVIYLPVPEDFTPQSYSFSFITEDEMIEEGVEYYH